MDRVFVDTAAFIAMENRSDQYHAVAASFNRELADRKVPLLTTNLVVAEASTWLQRHPRAGYGAALAFGHWLRGLSTEGFIEETETRGGKLERRLVGSDGGQPRFCLLFCTSSMEEEAWRFFTQLGASGATYTDCVSFAVMAMLGLKQAFTFDEDFAEAGFVRVP